MLFVFADLIRKYAVDCTLVQITGGQYVAGEYVPGEPVSANIRAVVAPMTQGKIYQSGGRLTSADRILYILKDNDSIDLESGQYYLKHNGKKYQVEGAGLYGEDYADFNEYTLRRVDKFDV